MPPAPPSGFAAPRRRLLKATIGAGLALPFIGRGAQAAVTWTLFSQQVNPASTVLRGLRRFSDLVRDRSAGALLVNVRSAGQLPIDAGQVLDSVAAGKVELGDDAQYATTIAQGTLMRLPLLANSPEEWNRVAKVAQPVLTAELARRGLVLLAHYRAPMQLFWSRLRAASFADIARQRMRVLSVEQAEFTRHFGGAHLITSTVEAGEILEAGKLDGTFGTAVGPGRTWKAQLKHVYLAGPSYNDAVIVANRAALERLQDGQAAMLAAVAAETGVWLAQAQDTDEQLLLRTLAGEGLKVSAVNSNDLLEGTAKLPAYWDSWVRLRSPETESLLAAVREVLDR
jgi:TRAP-type C4-dicarboxylate transport system substrate-binding protein